MSSGAVVDKVLDAFKAENPELIATNLLTEKEDALTVAFAQA